MADRKARDTTLSIAYFNAECEGVFRRLSIGLQCVDNAFVRRFEVYNPIFKCV